MLRAVPVLLCVSSHISTMHNRTSPLTMMTILCVADFTSSTGTAMLTETPTVAHLVA